MFEMSRTKDRVIKSPCTQKYEDKQTVSESQVPKKHVPYPFSCPASSQRRAAIQDLCNRKKPYHIDWLWQEMLQQGLPPRIVRKPERKKKKSIDEKSKSLDMYNLPQLYKGLPMFSSFIEFSYVKAINVQYTL